MKAPIARILSPLLLAVLAGCASPVPQGIYTTAPVAHVTPPPAPAERPPFTLSVNDEIELLVPQRPDLGQVTRVRPDGKIALPWIGEVQAESRTPQQLEAAIAQAFHELGAQPPEGRYLLSENDELEVRFPFQPDLNQVVRVRPDGYISLGLVKDVRAEGRTVEQLEEELVQRYRKHLREPELTVTVRNFSGNRVAAGGRIYRAGFRDLSPVIAVRSAAAAVQQIFVGGEVMKPGVLTYRPSLTALQGILEAGGYKPTGEMHSVMIIRKSASGQPVMIRRDLVADLKSTDGTTNDLYLEPSDLVLVPKTGIAEFAEALDQYVFQIVPFLKNSSFAFVYGLHNAAIR